jgi:hypothetical protein
MKRKKRVRKQICDMTFLRLSYSKINQNATELFNENISVINLLE